MTVLWNPKQVLLFTMEPNAVDSHWYWAANILAIVACSACVQYILRVTSVKAKMSDERLRRGVDSALIAGVLLQRGGWRP